MLDSDAILENFRSMIPWANRLVELEEVIWLKPIAKGKVSPAEIISHLTNWDRHLITSIIPSIQRGDGAVFPQFDPFNALAYDYAKSGISKNDLLAEFCTRREELCDLLLEVGEDMLRKHTTANGVERCPYTGTPYSMLYIIKEFTDHDNHHKVQINNVIVQGVTRSGMTSARLPCCWSTYGGSAHGVLLEAGLIDLTIMETFGMTGVAFHLFMHNQCSAASVTVYDWLGRHVNALDRVGVVSEIYHYEPRTNTYDAARQRVIGKIKQSINRGVAVIAWGIDTGEFGIIHGYDDEDGVFFVEGVDKFKRSLGSEPMLYDNLGTKFPQAPFIHVQIPIERVDYDREQAYRNSLQFYLDIMNKDYHMSSDFHCGFHAYDAWISTLENGTYDAFGLRYNTSVYTESKCYAAEYLRFLVEHSTSMKGLIAVADLFEEIAGKYRGMMSALEQDINGGHYLGNPVTKLQAAAVATIVRETKQLEKEAVELVRKVLE